MEINYESYKIFYTVAIYGSISKAAEALFISQPAITKSIKKPIVISFYRYNLRWMCMKDPTVEVRNLVKIIIN